MENLNINKKKQIFAKSILKWWRDNKRIFPWRVKKDPYMILIAELLLRKTTAAQVTRIYHNFINKYPTPKELAQAKENELTEILKPLGMEHKRAKILVKLGKTIEQNFKGKIPSSVKGLLSLPGVGKYAANAVLNLSYGKSLPMLDTNFIRIIQRVFSYKSYKARIRDDKEIWEFAKSLMPKKKTRDFNLSIIDFGATVCNHRKPKCNICPVYSICNFNRIAFNEFRD